MYCVPGVNTKATNSFFTNTTCLSYLTDLPYLQETHNYSVTSAKFSTFQLLNRPKVGGYLRVRIDARDGLNRYQTCGGDFWVAILDCPLPHYQASASAPVVDHNNGSYTVEIFVGWPTAIELHIILVHPSRAVKVLEKITSITYPSRVFWNGTFKNDHQQTRTLCYIDYRGPDAWHDKCAYQHRKALGETTAFVCDRPPRDNFTCQSLVEYRTASAMIGRTFHTLGDRLGCMWLFQG